jgi:ElaB/YqjD/DUF883 family membrane-anchored ribosome-binding protein
MPATAVTNQRRETTNMTRKSQSAAKGSKPMATTKSNSRSAQHKVEESVQDVATDAKQMTNDFVDYLTDYARENPGTAALWCLGVGFVLGWKLKPW